MESNNVPTRTSFSMKVPRYSTNLPHQTYTLHLQYLDTHPHLSWMKKSLYSLTPMTSFLLVPLQSQPCLRSILLIAPVDLASTATRYSLPAPTHPVTPETHLTQTVPLFLFPLIILVSLPVLQGHLRSTKKPYAIVSRSIVIFEVRMRLL
jgi:hypothetical protein